MPVSWMVRSCHSDWVSAGVTRALKRNCWSLDSSDTFANTGPCLVTLLPPFGKSILMFPSWDSEYHFHCLRETSLLM
jgi:hypothetical protein